MPISLTFTDSKEPVILKYPVFERDDFNIGDDSSPFLVIDQFIDDVNSRRSFCTMVVLSRDNGDEDHELINLRKSSDPKLNEDAYFLNEKEYKVLLPTYSNAGSLRDSLRKQYGLIVMYEFFENHPDGSIQITNGGLIDIRDGVENVCLEDYDIKLISEVIKSNKEVSTIVSLMNNVQIITKNKIKIIDEIECINKQNIDQFAEDAVGKKWVDLRKQHHILKKSQELLARMIP